MRKAAKPVIVFALVLLSGCGGRISLEADRSFYVDSFPETGVSTPSTTQVTSPEYIKRISGSGFLGVVFFGDKDLFHIVEKKDFENVGFSLYNCKFGLDGGEYIGDIYKYDGDVATSGEGAHKYWYYILFPYHMKLDYLISDIAAGKNGKVAWSTERLRADGLCFKVYATNMAAAILGTGMKSNEIRVPRSQAAEGLLGVDH